MDGNEPVTLYACVASGCALLSLRSDISPESHFLAVPGENGSEVRGLSNERPEDLQRAIGERMQRSGGVWTRVKPSAGESYVSARPWPAAGYKPPTKLLVVGLSDSVQEHLLPIDDVKVGPAEHILLPVDAASQMQLEQWIEGMKGLPGDLRTAMLYGLVNQGVLASLHPKTEIILPPVSAVPLAMIKRSSPSWIWLAAASLTAFAAGIALGIMSHGLTKSPPVEKTKASTEVLVGPMVTLESSMAASPDSQIVSLFETHIAPLSFEPPGSATRRYAEAWLILKLVLYQRGGPIVTEWSQASNRQALDDFAKTTAEFSTSQQNLVTAAGCYAGSFPVGGAAEGTGACNKVDWPMAQADLKALSQFAADGRKSTATGGKKS